MGKFYLTDDTYLIATGSCPDGMEELQAYNGLTVGLGDPPDTLLRKETPTIKYDKQRALAYPDVGKQLDALWHAMDTGVLPKIEPFYSDIKTVKDTYPKP